VQSLSFYKTIQFFYIIFCVKLASLFINRLNFFYVFSNVLRRNQSFDFQLLLFCLKFTWLSFPSQCFDNIDFEGSFLRKPCAFMVKHTHPIFFCSTVDSRAGSGLRLWKSQGWLDIILHRGKAASRVSVIVCLGIEKKKIKLLKTQRRKKILTKFSLFPDKEIEAAIRT